MFIGDDGIIGQKTIGSFDSTGGYIQPLTVQSKDKGFIGTLYLIRNGKEGVSYVEWCKGNLVQGAGVRIEVEKLIDFLENQAPKEE